MPKNFSVKISTNEITRLHEDAEVLEANDRQDHDNLLIVAESESDALKMAREYDRGILCKVMVSYRGKCINVIMLPQSRDKAF